MSKPIPPKSIARFLVCDDVRPELYGKLTIVGWYPRDAIALHPVDPNDANWNPTILSLALLYEFEDGIGTFDAELEITTPSSKSIGRTKIGTLVVEKGQPAGIVARLAQLPLPEFGAYTFTLYLGNKSYPKTITVNKGDASMLQALTQVNPTVKKAVSVSKKPKRVA